MEPCFELFFELKCSIQAGLSCISTEPILGQMPQVQIWMAKGKVSNLSVTFIS